MVNIYLGCVWIPAQDPVVLPAAQEQLGVSQAPGDGQDTPAYRQQYRYVSGDNTGTIIYFSHC